MAGAGINEAVIHLVREAHQLGDSGIKLGGGGAGDALGGETTAGDLRGEITEGGSLDVVIAVGTTFHVEVAIAERADFAAARIEFLGGEAIDANVEFALERGEAEAVFRRVTVRVRDVARAVDGLTHGLRREAVAFVVVEIQPFGGFEHGAVGLGVAGLVDPAGEVDDCARGRNVAERWAEDIGVGKVGEAGGGINEGAGAGAGALTVAAVAGGYDEAIIKKETLSGGVERAGFRALASALAVVELAGDGHGLVGPIAGGVIVPVEVVGAVDVLAGGGSVIDVLALGIT